MKRILVIQQYFYPDVSAVSQLLCDLLDRTVEITDYKITVLCGTYVRNYEQFTKQKLNVKMEYINTTTAKGKVPGHRLIEFMLFFWGVFWYIKRKKNTFDIIISMTTPPLIGFVALTAIAKSKVPFVYYVEDLYPELLFDMGYINRYWIIRKLRYFNAKIVSKAAKVITLGSYMTKKFYTNYNVDKERIAEIPNWTNGITYRDPQQKDTFNILYSGNLGLAHDFTQLSNLLYRLKEQDHEVEFSFVGAGRKFEAVQDIFKESGAKHSFQGYTNRIEHNNVLASADMFLISQKNETVGDIFPSKFYSYVAAGRPLLLLGTEQSEIGAFIKKRNVGCILEVEEDIPDVVDYIRELYRNEEYHKKMCRKIHSIYEDEMGLDLSVEKFIGVLNEVKVESN